ncbi:MAG: DUF192 domain-containing protein [Opitutales bacterium]
MRPIAPFFLIILIALLGIRCSFDRPLHADVYDWIKLEVGGAELEAQIALTRKEQAEGLMHRASLEPNQGMLFVFSKAGQQQFWMKNTSIPLDVGFFNSEGKLVEVHPLYPNDRTPVRSRSDKIVMALEMRQGWFANHGIRTGATLDRDLLEQAFKLRGMNTKHFSWYTPPED